MADDAGLQAGGEHPGACLLQFLVERPHLGADALRVRGGEVELVACRRARRRSGTAASWLLLV